ncbi:MAG: hypothetical protein CL760_06320 [Chloroflexi bacterium]|nr:hypothetical protein [Chloroflexota bacterium]|tara:strand:+ start:54038 stop:54295 length:258 start_codon:yes stop_codon:yes gene_type:complete
MQEQLEQDVNRILKDKHNITHRVKVSNVTTVGAHRRCSVEVGEGWVFDGIIYEELDGHGQFEYKPEHVAELMVDKIKRYFKYGKK